MVKPIDPAILVTAVERLLKFRYPTICRHSVACDLLDILEQHGAPITPELADAVVGAHDQEALALLPALRKALAP